VAADVCFESSSVARAEREKGGGRCGRVHVEAGEGGDGEGGAGVVVGSTGWSAMAPNRRARVASLPREQRRAAGVGDTSEGG
jgi:hypothetical protein